MAVTLGAELLRKDSAIKLATRTTAAIHIGKNKHRPDTAADMKNAIRIRDGWLFAGWDEKRRQENGNIEDGDISEKS